MSPDGARTPSIMQERNTMMKAVKWVDEVVMYADENLHKIDLQDEYNIRFMGADHKGKKHHPIKAKIIYISRDHDYSSTNIKKRCHERWLQDT